MKEKVEVAAVQMDIAWLDPEKNLERMIGWIEKIQREKPVDLIVFPELANTGYIRERNKEFGRDYFKKAEKIPGPFTEALGDAAKKSKVYIVSGFCELHPEIPGSVYNSAILINPKGEVLGIHHKLHIPGEENHYFYPGSTVNVYKTDLGNIGMVVCYDSIFPEICRILTLKGAEIICAPFNRPKRPSYDGLYHVAALRAYENRIYFIACNRVGKEMSEFLGRSAIASPDGVILARSEGEEEEVLYATFYEDKILEERAFFPIFADRRPELYQEIIRRF
ncbi:MAG: carbon-nitrogen hydrolase family protein [Deltaproteobacteria bacterium]|nr:carbon-nitrogen hydrolase family protein [Deltaproteobacteria bacterium]